MSSLRTRTSPVRWYSTKSSSIAASSRRSGVRDSLMTGAEPMMTAKGASGPSAEDADAPGPHEEPDHDQQDPVPQGTAEQRHDPEDDQCHRDQPKHELHREVFPS